MLTDALAFGGPSGPGGGTSPAQLLQGMLPFIVILAVFYMLIMRPQRQKQREHERLLRELKKGDRVVTSGGVHGVVAGVKDKTISVKVADNVRLEISKTAISQVIRGEPEETEAESSTRG